MAVPRDAAPGRYAGQVEVTDADGGRASLALGIAVLPVDLPVVARVPLEEVQERLRTLLEEKWAGGRRSAVA